MTKTDYQKLYQEIKTYKPNTPEYNLIQGQIYDNLTDQNYKPRENPDAHQITRLLNRGKIQEAEELTEETLEP